MDSTNLLNQIDQGQSQKEVTANENFAASSPAMLYARDAVTSIGLVWGFTGGRYLSAAIASGTLTLTASTTTYIVAAIAGGAVSQSTSITNWNNTATYLRLYLVVTGVSSVTSYEDHRQGIGSSGSGASLSVANTWTATQTWRAGAAGAATAGFKMQSGALNTTAEVGAYEFLTDKFYATITTGAARKEFTLNDAALTSGRLPFATTNGRLLDDSALVWDNTNKRLGIGAVAPLKFLHIEASSTGEVSSVVRNTSNGAAAYTGFFITNDGASLANYTWLFRTSTGYTPSGLYATDSGGLQSSTGELNLSAIQAGKRITFAVGGMATTNLALEIDGNRSVAVGNGTALATNATDGFFYIPTCAGTPTGTPTAKSGRAPMVIDSTNNRMYVYSGGAWVALN